MAQGSSNKKVTNRLVAASCAAVLAVYTAGYARTQSAANRLASQVAERRAVVPARERVTLHVPEVPSAAPTPVPIPAPARLIPQAPAIPDRAQNTTDTPSKEAGPAVVAKVVLPAGTAEHASPIEQPVRTPQVAEAPALPVAPVPVVPSQAAAPSIAPPPPEPAKPTPAKPAWKDGTYFGWGYSRHGDIEAEVVIEGGRIASAAISQCRTRYSCNVIDKLIPQVAQRQSPDVDYVSGATQSADAFYGAVVEALSKAK